MTVSFSKKGELLRLFYPTTDYKQFIEKLHTGVKINDSALIYLHDDINNVYSQEYIENTNGEYAHYECIDDIRTLLNFLDCDIKTWED